MLDFAMTELVKGENPFLSYWFKMSVFLCICSGFNGIGC